MHINVIFVATALLASASLAMSSQITGFAGADCTGSVVFSSGASSDECLTLGGGSVKSIGYSGVPSQIQFFESGGQHDSCTNGPQSPLALATPTAPHPASIHFVEIGATNGKIAQRTGTGYKGNGENINEFTRKPDELFQVCLTPGPLVE
ncbi:hypothetical protein C8R45DRAFT_935849 [Mycena sanguinolenta]|nr:hypothetical protein C8R45DRAFT_935849 [Mycena sanguinolenta]